MPTDHAPEDDTRRSLKCPGAVDADVSVLVARRSDYRSELLTCPRPNTLADWIVNGYNDYLGLGPYYSNTGAKFNASQMQDALSQRIGTVMLFPVYDTLTGNGANAQYNVIGWVGFHLESFDARRSSGNLYGYFTSITWDGLAAPANNGEPNFGARTVRLSH